MGWFGYYLYLTSQLDNLKNDFMKKKNGRKLLKVFFCSKIRLLFKQYSFGNNLFSSSLTKSLWSHCIFTTWVKPLPTRPLPHGVVYVCLLFFRKLKLGWLTKFLFYVLQFWWRISCGDILFWKFTYVNRLSSWLFVSPCKYLYSGNLFTRVI